MEILAFGLGALLLLTGILGGGFELKEVKIPKVGNIARAAASLVGVFSILLGFGLLNMQSAQTDPAAHPPSSMPAESSAPAAPITFNIDDQLGTGQLSEQVEVVVDGKNVGNLTVNKDYPSSTISPTVQSAGSHSYTVQSTAWFLDDQGGQVEWSGVGQGNINLSKEPRIILET